MANLSRQIIIDTALKLVIDEKKTNIKIEQIADQLDVTHAAIYKYFKNKNELWQCASICWFEENIVASIKLKSSYKSNTDELYDWLWQFANAKKRAANEHLEIFNLISIYLDDHPSEIRNVLTPSYRYINELMNYRDEDFRKSEAILSCFAIFTLPSFKETWNRSDYKQRFDDIWNMILPGL
ncbi:TetR/AcrR family transcriptional regulator [Lactobacillus terrae]|uniref:TetR/AcrR family transcriptional regulator n=1 Tax=Lactobacillus terrae TaxID=2269374 RepID=UPI000C1B6039|nr:TetR/AcrR family transcriptional regulator [Lactobacillus terrae]